MNFSKSYIESKVAAYLKVIKDKEQLKNILVNLVEEYYKHGYKDCSQDIKNILDIKED